LNSEISSRWMIYGAYGYTGQLVAEEAIRRGHRPVLAGRSRDKLLPLAERLDLDWVVFDLEDAHDLKGAVGEFDLVFHAAGPFTHTGAPMAQACLHTGANYLDIAGELKVFETLLSLDKEARASGVAIIPGVGFNVLATDCLAQYAAGQIPQPTHLEIATYWISGQLSRGSFKTMVENFPTGTLMRRDGELVPASVRKGRRRIRFIDREREVAPVTLGDLSTAFIANGIPNIMTYTALPDKVAGMYAWTEPIYRRLFASSAARRIAKRLTGPTRQRRGGDKGQLERSQAWVRASNAGGEEAQAWLETPDSYYFTAMAGVRCVEKVLAGRPQGALTPAQAFEADFVLGLPGTTRVDRLVDA
jgi:short subunit dehydrogenase-like uncharacterized protein